MLFQRVERLNHIIEETITSPFDLFRLKTRATSSRPFNFFLSDFSQVPFQSCLLPACDFLSQSRSLRKLSFRAGHALRGTGNANARVLSHVLACNSSLETLDLAHAGIDADGVQDLCSGLRKNKTLKYLSLRQGIKRSFKGLSGQFEEGKR